MYSECCGRVAMAVLFDEIIFQVLLKMCQISSLPTHTKGFGIRMSVSLAHSRNETEWVTRVAIE